MSEHPRRILRPRREGRSFAQMFQLDESDEDVGNESGSGREGSSLKRKRLPPIEEPASDSEYDPGEEKAESEVVNNASEDVSSELGEDDAEASLDDESDMGPPPSVVHSRTARDVKRPHQNKSAPKSAGQELAIASFNFTQRRPGNRTVAANPATGSLRARATPLYEFPGPSRRLSKKPSPFQEPQFMSTNGHVGSVAARVIRAWSSSVFPGPVWELLEDMAYFKEIEYAAGSERRRPVVHSDIFVPLENFELLDPSYVVCPFEIHSISPNCADQHCVTISAFR
jgi:transcription factor C subunit 6